MTEIPSDHAAPSPDGASLTDPVPSDGELLLADTAPDSCPHLSAYDPFAPAELLDPYPTYALARNDTPVFFSETMGLWFICRYEDVVAAVRDTGTFSSGVPGRTIVHSLPASATDALREATAEGLPDRNRFLLTTDAPEHNVRRKLGQQAFTPRRVAELESFITARTSELCDRLEQAESPELMGDFSYPLTTSVIAGIVGLDTETEAQMRQFSEDMLVMLVPAERTLTDDEVLDVLTRMERVSRVHGAVARQLAARRLDPRDDVLSALAQSQLSDGTRLTDEEIPAMVAELILAGTDTTANQIAHAVLFATPDRELWGSIGAETTVAEAVVEESLRRRGASKGLLRITTRDVEVAGVTIPKGAHVQLLYGSANHDEAIFADPAGFEPNRPNRDAHIAFGKGTHFCLGAPLARLETRVAIQTLARRFPRLSVSGDALRYLPTLTTHTLAGLGLVLDDANG